MIINNFSSNSKVNVNGVTIKTPSNASISVVNGKVYVNGKRYDGEELKDKQVVNVIIQGDVKDIECDGNVTINGDTNGHIKCGGNCSVSGSHRGSINAGGNVITGR